jgi:hypothetical protein
LKNFKTALMGDMKLWSSRHYRHRRRRYRRRRYRRRRGRSIVQKKKKEGRCKRQNVSHGEKIKKPQRGWLPYLDRSSSFYRGEPFMVRCQCQGEKKSGGEGKKKQ